MTFWFKYHKNVILNITMIAKMKSSIFCCYGPCFSKLWCKIGNRKHIIFDWSIFKVQVLKLSKVKWDGQRICGRWSICQGLFMKEGTVTQYLLSFVTRKLGHERCKILINIVFIRPIFRFVSWCDRPLRFLSFLNSI